jgi:hypothetical protein
MIHKEVDDLLHGLFIAGFVAGCRHMRKQLRAAPKPCEVDAEVGEVWFEALTQYAETQRV